MRCEAAPFGIDVIIIEPGGIAKPWGIIAAENLTKASANGVYAEAANRTTGDLAMQFARRACEPNSGKWFKSLSCLVADP